MYWIGIDTSLTCTGVVVLNADGEIVDKLAIKSPAAKGVLPRANRYSSVVRQVIDCLLIHTPCHVMVEGRAFGSAGYGVLDRCELAGAILLGMVTELTTDQLLSAEELAPTSLKKRVTGSGKGRGKEGKKRMKESLDNLYGYDLELETNDVYDALGLALCAGDWL